MGLPLISTQLELQLNYAELLGLFAFKPGTSDHVIGERSQFPLKLARGITAHKSQGQTLPAAYVHSGKEFLPGQLYVAASRVSTQKGLSILAFNSRRLIKADERVVDFYQTILFTLLTFIQAMRTYSIWKTYRMTDVSLTLIWWHILIIFVPCIMIKRNIIVLVHLSNLTGILKQTLSDKHRDFFARRSLY